MHALAMANGEHKVFSSTISLGALLQLLAMLGAVAMLYSSLNSGQVRLETQLSESRIAIERQLVDLSSRVGNVEKDHDSVIKLEDQVGEIFELYGKKGVGDAPAIPSNLIPPHRNGG